MIHLRMFSHTFDIKKHVIRYLLQVKLENIYERIIIKHINSTLAPHLKRTASYKLSFFF